MAKKCVQPEILKFSVPIYTSISQWPNILAQLLGCALSIIAGVFGNFVSLTVEMADVVAATCDFADIAAIAAIACGAEWAL